MSDTDRLVKIMDILEKNKLTTCSRSIHMFDEIKDSELSNNEKISTIVQRLRAYNLYLEQNPTTYPEEIMKILRRRKSLDAYDTSRDDQLNKLSPNSVLHEVCMWEGLINYDYSIRGWIRDIYKVDLDEIS